MAESQGQQRKIKLAITYRVIWHWRLPIFQRLADSPEYAVCVFHGSDFPGTKTVNATSIEGVPHRELFTIRWLSALPVPEWPICPALIFRLWQFSPDVILAEGNSNLMNNLQMFAYARLTKTPVVFWTLGVLNPNARKSRLQRIFRTVTRWMEERSAALLGYSSNAIDYFQEYGHPTEKQFKAVNVVDTDKVQVRAEEARPRVEPLRDELQLRDRRVVLFVGAITVHKRLEDLVDAFAVVQQSVPDARLVIVGDGPHMEAIREYVAKSAVAAQTIMTGKVIDGVSAYFLLGDVLVLPHLGGLAISEALAHGLPVIATEADGCELDLIEEGKSGFLVPVGDTEQLAQKVLQLLNDDALLADMKQQALKVIAEKYNVHTYVDGIKAAVNYAAASGKTRG